MENYEEQSVAWKAQVLTDPQGFITQYFNENGSLKLTYPIYWELLLYSLKLHAESIS